jgi:L-ascorbate metabolism protein UlaG (beta-lactamase superfamily)
MSIRLSELRTYSRFARQHARKFVAQRFVEARSPIPPAPFRPNPETWSDERVTLAWLGHATVLINFYGSWFLTDPALRSHVGVGVAGITIGPRRLVAPALGIESLPQLDAILVSHSHMDHCDKGTLRRLPRRTPIVAQSSNRDLFTRFRHVDELSWGDTVEINGTRIEAIEVTHWGARKLTDKHRGYGGFLIQKGGRSLVFGGDTAYTSAFGRLKSRSSIDAAILPIGAYNPYIHAHASPEQSWSMRREMGAQYIFPIHHSTFRLSSEPVGEPIERLYNVAGRESWRIAVSEPGQTWTIPED